MKQFISSIAIVLFGYSMLMGQAETVKPADTAPAVMPLSYGLVIDNSGSYRHLLEKVIRIVESIVAENKPDDEAFLVTFVDAQKIVLQQDFTSKKADLHDAAENMFIEGGYTALVDAVKFSAEHLIENGRSEPDRAKALVLVTDGDEVKSAATVNEVVKLLKDAKIKVFVIGIAELKVETKVIDRLSKETGGMKYLPRTQEQIDAAVKNLNVSIRAK